MVQWDRPVVLICRTPALFEVWFHPNIIVLCIFTYVRTCVHVYVGVLQPRTTSERQCLCSVFKVCMYVLYVRIPGCVLHEL